MTESSTYLLDTNAVSHIMRNTEGAVAQRYRKHLLSKAPPQMVTPPHTPIPFARELESAYLPSTDKIEAAVRAVLAWR